MAILCDVRQDPSLLKKKGQATRLKQFPKKEEAILVSNVPRMGGVGGGGGWAFAHMSICLINSFLSASLVASKGLGIEVFAY